MLGVTSSKSLPETPLAQSGAFEAARQALTAEGSASISGTVLDASGAAVAGAHVSLTHTDGSHQQTLVSNTNGEFTFTRLPAGAYIVIVDAKGFGVFTSTELDVMAQQTLAMPAILLAVAAANTQVTVRPTDLIAEEQIKAEEKQRLFGIVPNFYTSYVYDAAPMTARQKFSLAFHDTFDYTGFIGAGITAGIEQANNSFAGYGQGTSGYGKRYASAWGNGLFGNYLSYAVFPTLLHQDPRYFYQGTGTIRSRLNHALSFAFVLRGDDGKPMPNYSFILGDIGAGAISNLYYPHANRGVGLIFTNAAIGVAGRMGGTVIREFFLKRITTNVPANGKVGP